MVSWEAQLIRSITQPAAPPPRWQVWAAGARDGAWFLITLPFRLLWLWTPAILCLILFTLAYLGLMDVGDWVRHALHSGQ